MTSRLLRISVATSCAVNGSEDLTRMNDGELCRPAASSVPKSVSCDTTVRSCRRAWSRVSSSGAAASPTSRTATAS